MRYAQNYLQGQNQARQGQTTRVANQLDRIERKVGRIADGKGELPPPVPPKGESPPSSPSSVSSASTARPITPEAVMGDAIAKQFEDMRRLMATLIGQNNDILHEAEKRRSLEVELSPRGPGLRRIEDLLRRALLHLGDSEIAAELGRESIHDDQTGRYPEPRVLSEEDLDREGSMYPGSEGMYSDEFNPKSKAPANSFTDSYARRRRRPFSAVPESLLEGDLPESEFDEDFAMRDLPPQTPPAEYIIPHAQVPPHIANRTLRTPQEMQDEYPEDYSDYSTERSEEDPQEQQNPVPYRPVEQSDRGPSEYGDEEGERSPVRRLPTPQPVDLPTPVRSPGAYPPQMSAPYPRGGMPPPPPGVNEMLRPSLPRIAGVRDPISTT